MDVASIRGEVFRAQGKPGMRTDMSPKDSGRVLGKDDFLKLLITEMRYQTVTDPVDQKEFIAQMAQFSSLEGMQNLNAGISGLIKLQNMASAAALIGRKVEALSADGKKVSGTVSGVEIKEGLCLLVIGEDRVDVGKVTLVE